MLLKSKQILLRQKLLQQPPKRWQLEASRRSRSERWISSLDRTTTTRDPRRLHPLLAICRANTCLLSLTHRLKVVSRIDQIIATSNSEGISDRKSSAFRRIISISNTLAIMISIISIGVSTTRSG